jgi:hypothetical protein
MLIKEMLTNKQFPFNNIFLSRSYINKPMFLPVSMFTKRSSTVNRFIR